MMSADDHSGEVTLLYRSVIWDDQGRTESAPQRISHLTERHALEWMRVLAKDGVSITILDVIPFTRGRGHEQQR